MRRTVAGLAAVLVVALATPAFAVPPAPSTTTTSTATPAGRGRSPEAPDPHPPLGGVGPDGQPVGGARLLARGLVLPANAPALPSSLTAQAWVVADLDTGAIVAARDPHGRYQPASIQKLLTTVTLLPLLPGSRQVAVSAAAADTEGSHAGLQAGHRYTVDQLFAGLLLVSGNDCAEALAQAAGGRAATVQRMNATAARLGAYDTVVQTPSGLDGWRQLTSAYDMAVVLRAALAQPRFVAYDRAATVQLPGSGTLYNQNETFLTTVHGAVVAKTGFTDAAQHTFVGAVRRGGHAYGVVLLRAQRWPQDQWQQATALVQWARALPAGTAPVGTLPVVAQPVPARTSSAAAPSSSRPAPLVASGGEGRGDWPWPAQLALAAVVVVAALGLSRRYHRRC